MPWHGSYGMDTLRNNTNPGLGPDRMKNTYMCNAHVFTLVFSCKYMHKTSPLISESTGGRLRDIPMQVLWLLPLHYVPHTHA
jgi:hypothetical protein